MRRTFVALLCGALVSTGSAQAQEETGSWRPDLEAASRFAAARAGTVAFAVIDESGALQGRREAATSPMASVFKVMLMAAYLRQPGVRDRRLRGSDRALLGPMIRWSDNATAGRILGIVGAAAIHRVARDVGMRDFRLASPWGLSRSSPRDQAAFMFRLEEFLPDRHEGYARRLLSSIVRSQRWGIPKAAPEGWKVSFKGGWGTGTGRVCHQVSFLERDDRRIAVAVFTEFSPSHRYGTRTVRGVARRLLQGLAA
jgi:hypothetical protein